MSGKNAWKVSKAGMRAGAAVGFVVGALTLISGGTFLPMALLGGAVAGALNGLVAGGLIGAGIGAFMKDGQAAPSTDAAAQVVRNSQSSSSEVAVAHSSTRYQDMVTKSRAQEQGTCR